jgi:hypothetical protein
MNRMLNWFRLRKLESDLDRELKYHIDRRVSDLIHSGLPESEARRRAALELGHRFPCWLRTGFAGRPRFAGLLAPGAGRYSFRPAAGQGDCDGSERVYADSSRRGSVVCSNPLRAIGKRSGL